MIGNKTMQHVGLTSTRPLFATEFMTGCERSGNGAERAKTRVERSGAERERRGGRSGNGAVSGGQKNQD